MGGIMTKFLISIYIISVLLFAGLVNAADIKIQRLKFTQQFPLDVHEYSFNENQTELYLTGNTKGACIDSIQHLVQVESRKMINIRVVATKMGCVDRVQTFVVTVPLHVLANNHFEKGTVALVHVDNSEIRFEYENQ
jgi:hypothetical protein